MENLFQILFNFFIQMKNFSEKSSIHGIQFIFNPQYTKIVRAFWILAFVSSFCGFTFYIHSAYVKWQLVRLKETQIKIISLLKNLNIE